MRFIVAFAFLSAPVAAKALTQAPALPPPTAAEVKEQAQRLGPKNDKATRLRAVKWFNGHSRSKNTAPAIPALERCIRHDPDKECRAEAVLALAFIARTLGQGSCPPAIIETFLDKEDDPRWMAMTCVGFFKTYPAAAVDILLRSAGSEKPGVRSDSLLILARAGPKDKRALEAIEKGKQDKTFEVRHTAHIAGFTASDRLEEYLRFVIRAREDPDAVLSPVPKDPDAAKAEQAMRNLFILGAAVRSIEWSEKRAEDLAAVLVKILDDKSPVMRRGAANMIGAVVVKVHLPDEKQNLLERLLPYFEDEKKAAKELKKKPLEASQTAAELEKRNVRMRLAALRDTDPDPSVRLAAERALARLALVLKTKPK